MIISNGWAEVHWWKKAILSPGQPACSRHVCVPTLGLPGPNASSPTSTPAAGILPNLEATAPISPAENQVTCIWPLMAFCLLLGDLEPWPYVPSSAYHSLRAGVTSYSITVPTVGVCKYLLKERKIRGEWEEISRFENFTMERTFETRGGLSLPHWIWVTFDTRPYFLEIIRKAER